MDPQKDNIIKGEETNLVSSPKKNDEAAIFEKDGAFMYVLKKTEKLTSAIYLISNLFPDSEPMKWDIRKKVSNLLSSVVENENIISNQSYDFIHSTKNKVLEIISMLGVASCAGLISSMNFSIIEQEFMNLLEILDGKHLSGQGTHNALPRAFFEVPSSQSRITKEISNLPSKTSDFSMELGKTAYSQKEKTSLPDVNVFKRTNRQNIIIGLLKKKKEVSIKDVSLVIKDCSEKTIQRELISLINLGIIKKMGERRWSRYSLVSEN